MSALSPVASHLTVDELFERYRRSTDAAEKTQWQILWWRAQGRGTSEVAALSGFKPDWIRRIVRAYNEHGPDAVGFYVSGQLLTEDYYVFNKLAKGLLGTNNVDTNSRLCMSSAVAGYKLTLGADAPPACYDDVHHADLLFIAGSNTAWAHPVLYRRIEDARLAELRQHLREVGVEAGGGSAVDDGKGMDSPRSVCVSSALRKCCVACGTTIDSATYSRCK